MGKNIKISTSITLPTWNQSWENYKGSFLVSWQIISIKRKKIQKITFPSGIINMCTCLELPLSATYSFKFWIWKIRFWVIKYAILMKNHFRKIVSHTKFIDQARFIGAIIFQSIFIFYSGKRNLKRRFTSRPWSS